MDQQKYPEKCGLLGKLSSGEKQLDGKTFYFDRVKKRSATLLLEVITLFGGKIESFLHKEVSFVVTGCLEELAEREASGSNAKTKTANEETAPSKQESGLRRDRQKQGTPRPAVNACGSRGKALLEKAILNKERLQGTSILTNARSWGVKILYADDVLGYLKQLSRESFNAKSKKSEKVYNKQSSNVVKATPLRSPYLKIEDSSRKYKPLHMQSMSFPSLYYSGRYSPFECPPPPRFDKWTEPEEKKNKENKVAVSTEDKCQTPLSCNRSPWKPRKKDAYCECCRQTYNNQEEHLQSEQHRAFVLEGSNYSSVDQLVAAMMPGFNPDPPPQSEELKPETSTTLDVYELELLSDMETEDAVKALQTQESNFKADIPGLMRDTASPSIDNQLPEIQQSTTKANVDITALPLSPAMPLLKKMQMMPLLEPQQDLKPLSPCPVNVCQNSHCLPPVLSPQMADVYTHSSYLEAPILSPQQLTSQEPKDEQTENRSSVSQWVFVDPHHSTSSAITAAKSPEKSQAEMKVGYNSWERRSRSLPRQSTTVINPKKRSRSASPESSLHKKRRTDKMDGYEANQHQKLKMTKDIDALFLERISSKNIHASPKPVRTLQSYLTDENQDSFGIFSVPQVSTAARWLPSVKSSLTNVPMTLSVDKPQNVYSSHNSEHSNSHSTTVCIESALIPDVAAFSCSSSDSDWDCELLSRLSAPPKIALAPNEPNGELDQNLLQQPCPWMHDSSYESQLHSALQPPGQPMTMDASAFSRTVVQIVEVQH